MSAQTLTLTDFLLARIAEDESMWNLARDAGLAFTLRSGAVAAVPPVGFARRMLADCHAKRLVIEEHPAGRSMYARGTACETCCVWPDVDFDGPPPVAWPCPTLRSLALPYAEHSDYREEWKP